MRHKPLPDKHRMATRRNQFKEGRRRQSACDWNAVDRSKSLIALCVQTSTRPENVPLKKPSAASVLWTSRTSFAFKSVRSTKDPLGAWLASNRKRPSSSSVGAPVRGSLLSNSYARIASPNPLLARLIHDGWRLRAASVA